MAVAGVWCAIAFMSAAGAAEDGKTPDVFDVIGSNPKDVVAAIPRDSPFPHLRGTAPSPFLGMPMSESHRRDFIEQLRVSVLQPGPGSASSLATLLDLLDEDGLYTEALAVATSEKRVADIQFRVRRVGLLWKAGKESEAVALANVLALERQTADPWLSLVAVDLLRNRRDRAQGLLTFLITRTAIPASIRSLLVYQQVETACQAGEMDKLLENSATPVMRAALNAALGRKDEALACIKPQGAISTPRDLELMLTLLDSDPDLIERARGFLADPVLSTDQRASLLTFIKSSDKRLELFFGMPSGHPEVLRMIAFEFAEPTSNIEASRRSCAKIVERHANDPALHLLAARLDDRRADTYGKHLLVAVQGQITDAPRLVSQFSDPALEAISLLVPVIGARELETAVVTAPGFDQLPLEDRLRYLMAACLDHRIVEILHAGEFGNPDHDALSGKLASYFRDRSKNCVIPGEVVEEVLRRLPELVCGSISKTPSQMGGDANTWTGFLSSQTIANAVGADAVNRMLDAAGIRGDEASASVSRSLPLSLWNLPGLKHQPITRGQYVVPVAPAWWRALGTFAPFDPSLASGSLRYGRPFEARMLGGGRRAPQQTSALALPYLGILSSSGWQRNVDCALEGVATNQESRAIASSIRKLLTDQEPRAAIYDVLVASSVLPCKDPEVEARAEGHAAAIAEGKALNPDPVIPLYWFATHLTKNRKAGDPFPPFPDLNHQPIRVRSRLRNSLMSSMSRFSRDPAAMEFIAKQFALDAGKPPQAATPPEPLSPYDRMQFFRETGKTDSPESIELATKVLNDFVASGRPDPSPEENIAISTLVSSDRFEGFLSALKSGMEQAGKPEIEIQRALYRVHLYRIVHSNGESIRYGLRIFELDPTDTTAAAVALRAAIRDQDRALAVKALQAIARHSRKDLSVQIRAERTIKEGGSTNALQLFTGPHAHELVASLLAVSLPPQNRYFSPAAHSENDLLPLYEFVIAHDPENLRPILRWAGDMRLETFDRLIRVAVLLKKAGRDQEAVGILGDALFPSPDATDEKIRFRGKNGNALEQKLRLGSLAAEGFLKPLAEVAGACPESPSNALNRLLIQIGANPTAENWERIAVPFFATAPLAERENIERQLIYQIRQLPEAAVLVGQLTLRDPKTRERPPTLNTIHDKFKALAEINPADREQQASLLWNDAKPLVPRLGNWAWFLATAAPHIAATADPAVWREFLDKARAEKDFATTWVSLGSTGLPFALPPGRVAELMEIVLPKVPPSENNTSKIREYFEYLAGSPEPDPKVLALFKPWTRTPAYSGGRETHTTARLRFIELLESDPSAACPTINACQTDDGTYQVDWSLAGHGNQSRRSPFARPFPFLDGMFDVAILAGTDPDRLSRVATASKVAASGRMVVKAAGEIRYMALLATQRDGEVVRWSPAASIRDSRRQEAVPLKPVVSGKSGNPVEFKVIPSGGPFPAADATEIIVPAGTKVELAILPWEEGSAPVVSFWSSGKTAYGRFRLSYRNEAGEEAGTEVLESGDVNTEGMPIWVFHQTPGSSKPPAETVAVALVYDPGNSTQPQSFSISEPGCLKSEPSVRPDGFVRLGRIPASIQLIATDKGSNRFAVASAGHGVGVFDPDDGSFSGWIPLASEDRNGDENSTWMAMSGNRILHISQPGGIRLIDIKDKSVKEIVKDQGIPVAGERTKLMTLSPDGRFLAWTGIMAGIHLMEIQDDGTVKTRSIESPQIFNLRFDATRELLQARDGSTEFTLSLKGWEKAEMLSKPMDEANRWDRIESSITHGDSGETLVPGNRIKLRTDPDSRALFAINRHTRTLSLPFGHTFLTHDGKPIFINAFGTIFRIELERVSGFRDLSDGR